VATQPFTAPGAKASAAAFFNDQGTLIVSGSTLSGNSAYYGGGISNNWLGAGSATVTITNSTLNGNSAGFGAAS
jgi:hypothetical protein